MTTNKNRLRIDYKDMQDLKAALGGVEPGQRIVVEFELMVVANDDDFLETDIEGVSYESPELEDSEEPALSGSAVPTADEPVMVEVMRNSASKKPKAKPEVVEDAEETEDGE